MLADQLSPRTAGLLDHETPYFLFSRRKLRENFTSFRRAFPSAVVHYALKANSEIGVVKELAEVGCSFEAASRYELDLLREMCVPPARIIYGSAVKPAAHIAEFASHDVDRFAFDSQSELEKIAATAPGSCVYARIGVNDSGSVFKFSEKFGTDPATAASLLRHAQALELRPYGVSFHVGSQSRNIRAWASGIADAGLVLGDLARDGIRLEIINIGGGFPCQYASECVPSLSEIATVTMKAYEALPYRPRLVVEPGRGIVGDTGVLVASVIARVPRGNQTWLFLDAGVYSGLFEAMAYQGSTRYPIECLRMPNASGEDLFALAGPTGDSPDVIAREVLLPAATNVGDRIIIRNAGAYSVSVTSTFNGFPKPAVYFV